MSDVVTKRRPMIDLDEFEKRLAPSFSSNQKEGDPLAELLRVITDRVEPHFEPTADLSAKAAGFPGDFAAIEAGLLLAKQSQAAMPRDAERSTVAYKRPDARAPLIGGDFAAIEAALMSGLEEKTTAAVAESAVPNALPSVDVGADRWFAQEQQPASGPAADAGAQVRSRAPLYAMAALVIAGIAGIGVSTGISSRVSSPAEVVAIKAESASPQNVDSAANADVPAKEVAVLGQPPEPTPAPAAEGGEQPFNVIPQADATKPVEPSQAQIELPPVPPAPTPADPPIAAASAEPNAAAPDAALLPSGTAPPVSNSNETPPVAPQSPVVAKPPAAKAAARVAKPSKAAAAKHPTGHGQPHHLANNAKPAPVSPLPTEPAPSADLKAAAPAAQPSPASNGPFGFVQSAVNSLTSTTAKLMDWGGARP
jgi:hypothetical protein